MLSKGEMTPYELEVKVAAEGILPNLRRSGLRLLRERLADCAWQAAELGQAVKQSAAASGLKMPQLAIPLRVALLGLPQSPSIDAVLAVMGRERVLERLEAVLAV